MERTYQYRGDLKETALPEMLHTIYRTRIAGVIEASRGEIVKRVWIKDGDVVHAASSDREDSLGSFLRRSGRVPPEDLEAASRQRGATARRLGELLVERGVLSPAAVYRAIREQAEAIVWSLFSWEEGVVAFSIGEAAPHEAVRILVPMRQVIVQGIRRAPNAKTLIAKLGRKETLFSPCYRVEDLVEIALDEREFQLLSMVNGRRSVFELCTQGPLSPAENGKLLYAYSVLNLVRRSEGEEGGVIKIRMRMEREG
ncbi:MAG: DUF4388 domain-containing protein [Holophagales bacterium]|nr:MAG: DUF4388 domain-containing protein [Holophagales bacterium]